MCTCVCVCVCARVSGGMREPALVTMPFLSEGLDPGFPESSEEGEELTSLGFLQEAALGSKTEGCFLGAGGEGRHPGWRAAWSEATVPAAWGPSLPCACLDRSRTAVGKV